MTPEEKMTTLLSERIVDKATLPAMSCGCGAIHHGAAVAREISYSGDPLSHWHWTAHMKPPHGNGYSIGVHTLIDQRELIQLFAKVFGMAVTGMYHFRWGWNFDIYPGERQDLVRRLVKTLRVSESYKSGLKFETVSATDSCYPKVLEILSGFDCMLSRSHGYGEVLEGAFVNQLRLRTEDGFAKLRIGIDQNPGPLTSETLFEMVNLQFCRS